MYLINYDFYDIHALIVFFRNFPKGAEVYTPALEQVTGYIDRPVENSLNHNTIRKIIKPYVKPEDKLLSWANVENVYTANIIVIKNEVCYKIVSSVLKEIVLSAKDLERVSLVCDVTHNIPELLADERWTKKGRKLSKILISMVEPYRKQYNTQFLQEELKLLQMRR